MFFPRGLIGAADIDEIGKIGEDRSSIELWCSRLSWDVVVDVDVDVDVCRCCRLQTEQTDWFGNLGQSEFLLHSLLTLKASPSYHHTQHTRKNIHGTCSTSV